MDAVPLEEPDELPLEDELELDELPEDELPLDDEPEPEEELVPAPEELDVPVAGGAGSDPPQAASDSVIAKAAPDVSRWPATDPTAL